MGSVLAVWMFPQHKIYESSLSMIGIFFTLLVIEKPSKARFFMLGVVAGITAFFSRNFGFYNLITFLFVTVYIGRNAGWRPFVSWIPSWGLGVVIGYAPVLVMMLLIPGFLESFLDSIRLLFSAYAPVLPVPIPWPWTLRYGTVPPYWILVSLIFLLAPLFYFLTAITLLWRGREKTNAVMPLLAASVFVGIPLTHHAFVRSDLAHVAQSIQPFLVGLAVLSLACVSRGNRFVGLGVALFMGVTTVMVAYPRFTDAASIKMSSIVVDRQSQLVSYAVAGDVLWVPKSQAEHIDAIKSFAQKYVKAGEEILIAPYSPGLYPILGRRVPVWDSYALFPVSETEQDKIIQDLLEKRVNWVLIDDRPTDGMDQRRFSRTHAKVWAYLHEQYKVIDSPGLTNSERLFHRRNP